MITVAQAQAIVREASRLLGTETVGLADALGRVTADAIVCTVDLPGFDNSAMDGFALHAGESGIAAGRELHVAGRQSAGDAIRIATGDACEIMTGAAMPQGFDAVIPVEQIEVIARHDDGRAARIRTLADVEPGQHVRRAGEDIAAGDLTLAAGTIIDAHAQMLLAGIGSGDVAVRKRVRVALINTGKELVDDARAPLASGQIRNTNGLYLHARLQQAGADVVLRETVVDEPAQFLLALQRAQQHHADIIVSTGAVSMGAHDFIPEALRTAGAEILFHKITMRPGKPLLFARMPSGALVFGLPGNPVSCVVGQRFFVEPALRAMAGLPIEQPVRLPLLAPVRKKSGMTVFHKAAIEQIEPGRFGVRSLPGQESFRIRPLLHADAWLVLPQEDSMVEPGELVDVFTHCHVQSAMWSGKASCK